MAERRQEIRKICTVKHGKSKNDYKKTIVTFTYHEQHAIISGQVYKITATFSNYSSDRSTVAFEVITRCYLLHLPYITDQSSKLYSTSQFAFQKRESEILYEFSQEKSSTESFIKKILVFLSI
jgi:hypothetical protein